MGATTVPQSGCFVVRATLVVLGVALAWAALTAWSPPAQAAPANPHLVKTFHQPDGSPLELRLWGDEFAHGYETLDGFTVLYDERTGRFEYAERTLTGDLRPSGRLATRRGDPGQPRHLRPAPEVIEAKRRAEDPPSLGDLVALGAPDWAGGDTDILFLIVEFTDTPCSFTPGQHETNMFGGGASGPGDLDDYFREISYGQLEFVGDVVGNEDGTDCIALSEDRAHYDTGEGDFGDDHLVREAVAAVDDYVDFSEYDNDGDGAVDALGIIYAGGGAHDGCGPGTRDGRLWPHSGRINSGTPPVLFADGRQVERFIINSEVTYSLDDTSTCDEIQTVGLFAHELGHSLGLPDLYDTEVGSGGVGTWSAMASQYASTVNLSDTPPHYDAWSKAVLGWVTPTEHDPNDVFNQSLAQVETSPEVHQFLTNPLGFETGEGLGEYFLIENRQQTGFDAQLEGCGILVWHIDELQANNQENFHRLVDLEQADGLFELNDNDGEDDGDPFPGSTFNTLFADSTTPDSKLYGGGSSNLQMRVQTTECAPSMNVLFGDNSPPVADAGGPYTTTEGTAPMLDGSGSSDPDGDALTFAWEWTGASTAFDDADGPNPLYPLVGDDADERVIGLRVTDPYNQRDIDATKITVTNVAPTVGPIATDAPKPEGSTVTVSGVIADPGWLDDLTGTIDWGDGSDLTLLTDPTEHAAPDATLAYERTHAYADNGAYAITVCAQDDDGGMATCKSTIVVITNVAPAVSDVTNDGPKPENLAVTINALVSDPGWADDLAATIDWGDGSGAQPVDGTRENDQPHATLALAVEHVYGDNGAFTVTVCATDDDGGASPCVATDVTIGNVDPTALIDKSGSATIDGVQVLFGQVGEPLHISGRMTDDGSDDLVARWSWDDGSPDTVTEYRVNPLFPDPFPSPTVEPRDVTDSTSHSFVACVYDVGFRSIDDDAGASPTDMVKVLITGDTPGGRQSGYWSHQYRRNGARDFTDEVLGCYLEITAYLSEVFHEARDASTIEQAQKVLFAQGTSVTPRDQLDRDLLTAWLNFANGAVAWDELVDTDGDGATDTPFHQALATAEDVRLAAGATTAQLNAQRNIVQRINDTV